MASRVNNAGAAATAPPFGAVELGSAGRSRLRVSTALARTEVVCDQIGTVSVGAWCGQWGNRGEVGRSPRARIRARRPT